MTGLSADHIEKLMSNPKIRATIEANIKIMINQNEQVFNPVPRFERINNGFCPDCGEKVNDNGLCVDCHIVPSLDPEFQQWLQNPPIIKAPVGLDAAALVTGNNALPSCSTNLLSSVNKKSPSHNTTGEGDQQN